MSYLSLDPAMRGWLDDVRSYIRPVRVGEVMRAFGTGVVLQSRHPDFAPGDEVTGMLGAADHAVVPGASLRHIDLGLAAAPTWLGALGLTGLTAWFGLFALQAITSFAVTHAGAGDSGAYPPRARSGGRLMTTIAVVTDNPSSGCGRDPRA